ncbi:MAG: hypothetical protein JW902_17850 [Syntrophaceae bacterium]|nr:hypothetical protein [Syntrophaceae bacterium]
MKKSRVEAVFVPFTAFLLTLYPFVLSYQQSGLSSCFSSFAADAFYYLTVAKNLSWDPIFSFDGLHATNGFHPLWQVYLKTAFTFFPGLAGHQEAQLLYAYWTGAFCTAVAAAILSLVLRRLTRSSSLALIAVVPGLVYFVVALADQRYGALWSYVNGMESAFSLLLFAGLVAYVLKFKTFTTNKLLLYIPQAILVSSLVLARLDDVFIVPALCAPLLLSGFSRSGKFFRLAVLGGFPAIVILLYCAFNVSYAGTALPISSQIKGNLDWQFNVSKLKDVFLPFLPLAKLWGNPWSLWRNLTWRALHNCIPAILSIAFLLHVRRRNQSYCSFSSNTLRLLSALSLYVIAKAAYNFIFVGFWHQGHWYFPLSLLVASTLVAVHLSRATPALDFDFAVLIPLRHRVVRFVCIALLLVVLLTVFVYVATLAGSSSASPIVGNYSITRILVMLASTCLAGGILLVLVSILRHRLNALRVPTGFVCTMLLVLFSSNTMMADKTESKYNQHYYRFWSNRDRTTAQIREVYSGIGVLSFDDGIVAYSLDIPVMSGLGFTLDLPALRAMQDGKLLDIAYARGFRWLTSLNYMPNMPAVVGQDVTEEVGAAFWLSAQDTSNWVFRIAYVEPETGCRFVEFERKQNHTTTGSTVPAEGAPSAGTVEPRR